jgi:hypothetical protein
VQRAELLDHEKSEDDDGPAGIQEILPTLPQAHAAQGSEVTPFAGVIVAGARSRHPERSWREILRAALEHGLQGRKLNG